MKKTSVVSFLITLLLAAAVCTHGREYVTDTDGNPVQQGVQYFVGLVPYANQTNSVCLIRETFSPDELGHPVVFESFPPHPFTPLLVDLPVSIEFKFKSEVGCDENSPFWYVHAASSAIVLQDRRIHWFAIEKAGEAGANTYKFRSPMGPVRTKPEHPPPVVGGPQVLVVTNDNSHHILHVKFRKVDAAATATTSTSRVEKLGLRMFPFY